MTTHLGFYNTSSTRTHVRFHFSTHVGAGANVAPLSAFEAADIRIYRAADGAAFSSTQRSSSNGITMTSPFDSLTGYHDVDIDLTDNTDAGFYASGYLYLVTLAPDTETIDGQTITGIPLEYFEIGVQPVNATQLAGQTITAAAGVTFPASVASPTNITAGTITTVTNLTNAPTNGDLTAAMKASVNAEADTALSDYGALQPTTTGRKLDVTATGEAGIDLDNTAGTLAKGVELTGFNDLDAAGVRSAVGLATANLDTQLDALPTAAENATAVLSAAASAPIASNVKQVNDVDLQGDGSTTPWGPV